MRSTEDFPEAARPELPREVIDLGRKIAALPPGLSRDVEAAFNQVVDCVHRRRRLLALVQEALAELRLDIKYLMFDLDVTRKERDQLKSQLDELERRDPGY
ncbi:MAG: transcriptional regulator [Planctomyces sp.]|nr:transcriptional regulator [Planctomyces sp.]